MITFACHRCGKVFQTVDQSAGKSGKCSNCGESIQVPAAPVRQMATAPPIVMPSAAGRSDADRSPPMLPPYVLQATPIAQPTVVQAPPIAHPIVGQRAPSHADQEWLDSRQEIVDIGKWKSEFASVRWRTLFPIRAWLDDRPWNLLWVQFLAFAFCFPLALIHFYQGEKVPLTEAAWAFSLYFAIIWAAFLHRCMRPESLSKKLVIGTWFFTSFLGVLAVALTTLLGNYLPGVRHIFAASESANIFGRLVGFTLAVGLVEEVAKAIPIFWFARKSSGKRRPSTTAYVGVISGLAFGATEAIVYSVQYAAGHAAARMTYGDYLVVQVLRLVSLPFLHAIWSGILGYLIGLAMLAGHSSRAICLVGIALVSVLHGGYDTFANNWLGFVIALVSLFLFIGYIRVESTLATSVQDANVAS